MTSIPEDDEEVADGVEKSSAGRDGSVERVPLATMAAATAGYASESMVA